MKIWIISLLLIFITADTAIFCQQEQAYLFEQEAIRKLNEKGISLIQFKEKLLTKGLEYDQLLKMEASELSTYQKEIDQVITELTAEKLNSENKKFPSAIQNKINIPIDFVDKTADQLSDQANTNVKDNIILVDSISKIWGHHLFKNRTNFQSEADSKVPDHYILGVGDIVTINIWGISQLNEVFTIGADGYINPSRMPRLFLKGLSLSKAKLAAAAGFRRFYQFNENQFDLSLNTSRVIQVNVTGEIKNPGAYYLSAKNHAVNALFAAGGPSYIGSVRNIKILRKGKEIAVDLYKYMTNPSVDKDFYLEENDYIYVPVISKVVGISGAVNRPAYYELKPDEDLTDLINLAGGLKENAFKKTIQIARYDLDKKIILDAPYSDLVQTKRKFQLVHGDQVKVAAVKEFSENFVSVSGAVRAELSFGLQPGWKVSDLLAKIELNPYADTKNSYILRNNPDKSIFLIPLKIEEIKNGKTAFDIFLQSGDELVIKKLEDYTDKSYVSVSGAVRNPGKYFIAADGSTTVNDLINLSGGIRSNAWKYAYLFREDASNKKKTEIVRIELQNIQKIEQNPVLQKFDSLVILAEEELSAIAYVEINGAVKRPGRYKFAKGMTSYDLITLALGYTYSASTKHIEIFRVIISDGNPTTTVVVNTETKRNLDDPNSGSLLEPFDIIVVRSQPQFTFQNMVRIDGEVIFPGQYALIKPNEQVSEVIRRAGGLTPEAFASGATLFRSEENIGYIIMDLKQALKNNQSRYNFILKNGDVISIPKQRDLVRIAGETNISNLYPDKMFASDNSIAVAYHNSKRARFYINKYAAGVNEQGDLKKITVEHANGRVEKTRNYFLFRMTPKVHKGSVILVGPKIVKKEKLKKEKNGAVDWEKVLTKTLTATTAIFTMVLTYNSIVK